VAKFQLALLIHAHQPVGNFDDVIERAYQQCYSPFVQVLERHPSIRMGLHYSGALLEWLERAHPEYFEQLRVLVKRGQVEIVGGGFYEPILVAAAPKAHGSQSECGSRSSHRRSQQPALNTVSLTITISSVRDLNWSSFTAITSPKMNAIG
jgi:alpha-amylase/alpha-mannosidase (GH57 family)